MNYRPIGVNHGEHCDSGEFDDLCDECRAAASHDWED